MIHKITKPSESGLKAERGRHHFHASGSLRETNSYSIDRSLAILSKRTERSRLNDRTIIIKTYGRRDEREKRDNKLKEK